MNKRLMGVAAWAAFSAFAGQAWAGAGTSGAQILLQDQGARPAGMAGAYTALAGDINSLGSNPAGLADLGKAELTFMHFSGIEGLGTEWLAGGAPVPGLGTLAAQVLYRGQPAIDNAVDGEAPVEVRDLLFGVSYATGIIPGLRAGVNAKVVLMTLGPGEASAFALDLGAQYTLDGLTRFGAVARNLGSGVKFRAVEDPLPLVIAVGASAASWPTGRTTSPSIWTWTTRCPNAIPSPCSAGSIGTSACWPCGWAMPTPHKKPSTAFPPASGSGSRSTKWKSTWTILCARNRGKNRISIWRI